MEVSGQLHALAALTAEKELLELIGEEAWWAPEPVWTLWSVETFPAPDGYRTPRSPVRYLVPIPAELSRLLHRLYSVE
jgi:hypothetical protein